jgi:hypothetical protein
MIRFRPVSYRVCRLQPDPRGPLAWSGPDEERVGNVGLTGARGKKPMELPRASESHGQAGR